MKNALFAFALLFVVGSAAYAQDIMEDTDATPGATVFSPKTVERVRSEKASFIHLRVYPVIIQTLDKNTKQAALKVEVYTPLEFNPKSTLVINVDGDLYSDSPEWTDASKGISERTEVASIDLHDAPGALSLRKLASAQAISVIAMYKKEQIAVRLTGARLGAFKLMFDKYTALLPQT